MDNVAPYDIVRGNPAKRVGRRFWTTRYAVMIGVREASLVNAD